VSDKPGDESRRRSKRGTASRWPWVAVALVALMLVVNLSMSFPALMRGETPDGVLGTVIDFLIDLFSGEVGRQIALWTALLPAAAAGGFGVYWAAETYARTERRASLWTRRAFIVSLTCWIALIVVIMDISAFPSRTAVAIAAAALLSIQAIPFALASRSASEGRYGGRVRGSQSRARRRRRSPSERTEEGEAA